ncbi:MAG: heparinase II/III family protein [Croceibacterium sp.]
MTESAIRNRFVTGVSELAQGAAETMAIPLHATTTEPLVTKKSPQGAVPPGELIEPGRALVVADFAPPQVGAGERLIRLAYRLGVPGHSLAAPFRKPAKLRLLATVANPIPGDRVAGTALRAGYFLVYGAKAMIAQIDFSPNARHAPPLERVIHGFAWLRDLEACAPRPQCAQTAERVLNAWLMANPAPGRGPAWKIGHTGHRLLGWLVHAPLLLSGTDKRLRTRTLCAMCDTARWLDRHVGKAGDRLEETAGWCAIIGAGLLLPEGKPRRLFGEAGLVRTLGELVGNDGGVLSRSPLDQIEAIELLVELTACYRAVRRDPPQAVEAMLQMLVPPLLALVHGDGALGSWQGAGAVSAPRLARLIDASGVRTRPLRDARQWGYQRVSAGKSIVQFDAAPPPLARHTRHGCASTLAFELSSGPHRVVINCGGSAFAGGLVPLRIEQGLRATAAHSTLVLGDANSTAVMVGDKLGTGVGEVEVDRRTLELESGGTATRLEASHDGYVPRFGLVHRRILIMRDDGTELRGEDLLVPAKGKGKRGKVPYAIRFHLGQGVDATPTAGARGAALALPDGSYWQFAAGEGAVELEESLWVDGDGRAHPVQQLILQGMVSRGGGSFSWLLKKIR